MKVHQYSTIRLYGHSLIMIKNFLVVTLQRVVISYFVVSSVTMAAIVTNLSKLPAGSTSRITNHACFAKTSLDECQHVDDMECLWCEYWCVQKIKYSTKFEGCHKYSDELSEFYSKPQIIDIKPKVFYSDMPTFISIYGSHFFDFSENVYNRITAVNFNSKSECKIYFINYSLIECILEGFDHTVNKPIQISMTYSFKRLVFGLDESNQTESQVSIFIMKSDDEWFENSGTSNERTFIESLHTIQTLVGITFGICLCSAVFAVYLKRQIIKDINEIIKKRFFFRRMRKQLIENNLFAEYRSIEYKHKLGEGNFGEVYSALMIDSKYNCSEMAVKRLRKGADVVKMELFITEGIRMSSFNHNRILSTVAIFYDRLNSAPAIVLPIMHNGDLCRYLRQAKTLHLTELSNFALQISQGMKYLSNINFVHGDLAARNCLLDYNLEIKIGDFGMSRHLYRTDYVTINDMYRPIRWMAIECLVDKKPKFTIKSDVWSFGVVLWEIFTHGLHPYEEFDDVDLSKKILDGYHLHKPYQCPDSIYQLMLNCWSIAGEERPTFSYIEQRLRHILESDSQPNVDEQLDGLSWTYQSLPDRKETNYTTLAERYVINLQSNNSNIPNDSDYSRYYCQS